MNVLALPFDASSLRALQPVLRELAARGHQVELALAAEGRAETRRLLGPLSSEVPQIVEVPIRPRTGWWWPVADAARARGTSDLFERLLPPDPGFLKLLHRSAPDLVLVVSDRAAETAAVDLMKAARSLALRTVLVVRGSPDDGGAAFRGVSADRTLIWPDRAANEPHYETLRFTDALEAAAGQPVRPWRTLPGAALLRTILRPLVSAGRRRVLERRHGDMWSGVEQLERPCYAPPSGASVEGLEQEIQNATKPATDALALVAASRRPILIGPWTGPPERELLYWIPFLKWASRAYPLAPERFVVVSRGGPRHWYGALATRYFELSELLGRTSGKAPESISEAVVAQLRAELGQDGLDHLDPTILCDGLLCHHWNQRSPIDHLLLHAVFEPLPAPAPDVLEEQLPDDFYAVRFEPSPWFRNSPENRALALRLLGQLTRRGTVVLLDRPDPAAAPGTGYWLEEELSAGRFGNRLVRANGWLAGADELEVQTRIVANSRGFVGSYGVTCLLAAFLSKPSVSLHDAVEGVPDADLDVASTVFRSFGSNFLVLTGEELALAGSLL